MTDDVVPWLLAIIIGVCGLAGLFLSILALSRSPSPPTAPTLHDATFYYLKAGSHSYKVLILHDGSHALVQEPVE